MSECNDLTCTPGEPKCGDDIIVKNITHQSVGCPWWVALTMILVGTIVGNFARDIWMSNIEAMTRKDMQIMSKEIQEALGGVIIANRAVQAQSEDTAQILHSTNDGILKVIFSDYEKRIKALEKKVR